MNIISALVLFLLFILIYMMIVEAFTIFFRLTGLVQETAHMQVISMLTGCGFTTKESEVLMSSKKRRQLTKVTILFGYAFNVTIVSILVNVIVAMTNSELSSVLYMAPIIVFFFILLTTIVKNKHIRKKFDHMIGHLGNRLMFGKNSNTLVLIDSYDEHALVEIDCIHVPKEIAGKRLQDTELREKYHISVMTIKTSNKKIALPTADTIIKKDDVIIVFGIYKSIRELFENVQ